jgi:hypothetical protein
MIAGFSTEAQKARRAWKDTSQARKENSCLPRLMYQGKLSFIIEGEIKTFHTKQRNS